MQLSLFHERFSSPHLAIIGIVFSPQGLLFSTQVVHISSRNIGYIGVIVVVVRVLRIAGGCMLLLTIPKRIRTTNFIPIYIMPAM